MYPKVPPPITDVGAWTVPRTLQRWLDPNPITRLTRTQAFITLPSFSVTTIWGGYSDIVAAFNYEGPNNFSFVPTTLPTPINPGYLLCVMWKDSIGNTHRYKMWENVGEVLYFSVPNYSGQLIKKNFRFEIWSVSTGVPTGTIIYVIGAEGGGAIGAEGGGFIQ